jgi:hypothetical protein
MKAPIIFEAKQRALGKEIRAELIELLNTYYEGHYMRQDDHAYIKQSSVLGSPIIYELKVDEENDNRVLYCSGLLHGNFIVGSSSCYYELFDDCVLEVYKTLYDITFKPEE